MHIAIAEDDTKDVAILTEHIKRFERENQMIIQYSVFSTGAALLEQYCTDWDLILLDIEMPDLDGIATAKKIRSIDADIPILFITQIAQYALSAYEVAALDYILKPVQYYIFSVKLKRVIRLIQTNQQRYIIIECRDTIHKILLRTIFYIEIMGHTMIYHTSDGIVSVTGTKTMKVLEQELTAYGFFRCDHCYLVNLQYVSSFENGTAVLSNPEHSALKVSRNRKKAFTQALLAYLGR